ncbi:MAG: FdhD protein [Acidobacteriota bacterium]|nr:FdhD protein [Acidobacteriota bacterium]
MPPDKTASVDITRVTADVREQAEDVVAVEEPLEIRAAWQVEGEPREQNISVTMRTPGDDFDLAVGFLFTEGLVRTGSDIESVRHWGSPNQVRVALKPHARIDASKLDRHFYTTSSCGVCGKTSIDALYVVAQPLEVQAPLDPAVVRGLPGTLQEAQTAFLATGGVHGAALFDRGGKLLRLREDVGRHNAVDKVIGSYVREEMRAEGRGQRAEGENGRNGDVGPGFSLGPRPSALGPSIAEAILAVSSRGSFEIVQKAVVAGIGAIAFIGGPSSLAVDLARRFNVTLVGFVRDGRFNVYAGRVT